MRHPTREGLDGILQNKNENIYHYYLLSKAVGIDPVRQPEEGGCPSGKQGQAGKGVGRQKQEGVGPRACVVLPKTQ